MPDDAYYRQQFFAESRDMLDSVSDALLKVESCPADADSLHSIFRSIHTIKGSAGVFSLDAISAFAHHFESTLNRTCEGSLEVTPELIDLFFQGVDALNALFDACQKGVIPPVYDELSEKFKQSAQGSGPTLAPIQNIANADLTQNLSTVGTFGASSSALPVLGQAVLVEQRQALAKRLALGEHLYEMTLHFTTELLENGYDPQVLLKNLKANSSLWFPTPTMVDVPLEAFSPLTLYLGFTAVFTSPLSFDEVQAFAFDEELLELRQCDLQPVLAPPPDADTADGDEDIDPQCLKDFLLESSGLVEQMEKLTLQLEKKVDPAELNALFRTVHTIKGDAAYVGLRQLSSFAHELEALLEKIRTNLTLCTPAALDMILQGVDTLKGAIHKVKQGNTRFALHNASVQMKTFVAQRDHVPHENLAQEVAGAFLNQLTQQRHILETLCAEGLPETPDMVQRVEQVIRGLLSAAAYVGIIELKTLTLRLKTDLDAHDARAYTESRRALLLWMDDVTGDPRLLGEILVNTGVVSHQDLKNTLNRQKPLGEMLMDEGKLDRKVLDDALKKQSIMRVASAQQQEMPPLQQTETTEVRVMRVDEDKIDRLSNMIGELVVAKNAYDYLIGQLADKDVPPVIFKSFKDNVHLFSRISSELQQGMLAVRMIPIRGIFQKYARVVRDIARKQHKFIDFITEGDETEIDKKVADILSEPLIHMVRNACDHGIESPEDRIAAGKSEKGTVRLKAYQEGSRLYVQIFDDGKGINRQKLYEKALQKGFPVSSPDDVNLLDILFLPGFSTKEEITDVSGRGVGMDAVRTSVESLGGIATMRSEQGTGSSLTLELPMTMGISVALVVEAKDKAYAIPLDCVVETVKIPVNKIKMFYDHKGIYYRGEVLPLERLDVLLFQTSHTGDPRELFSDDAFNVFALHRTDEEITVVVLATAKGRFGVVVDGLTRNVEIAIRPVPDVLAHINVLSGVSILGDGKILLVLNPDNLV